MDKSGREDRKKRIMLIMPMLHQGGFERICVLTAKLLQELYEVYLVVFTTEDAFYDVSGLNLIDLNLGSVEGRAGKLINIYKRTKRLRQLKRELGIDISYSFGTTANIANVLSKGADITWAGIRGYNALSDRGAKLVSARADCVVSCTKTMEAQINERFHTKKSITLYNPCDIEAIKRSCAAEPDEEKRKALQAFAQGAGPLIVSMGREDDLKGFWHLIKIFAVVRRELADARLMIIGNGSYDEYRKLAADLGVVESVCFTGVLKNPFPLLARADVYVLTSQSEGFPNALIEAMACGTACISVNCFTGPAEILADTCADCVDQRAVYRADYGILTPVLEGEKDLTPQITMQEEQFAEEVIRLLKDDEKRMGYSRQALKRAQEFGVDRYVEHLVSMIEAEVGN